MFACYSVIPNYTKKNSTLSTPSFHHIPHHPHRLVERLHRTVAAGDAYIRVLEESLRAIGLLRPHPERPAEAESDGEE